MAAFTGTDRKMVAFVFLQSWLPWGGGGRGGRAETGVLVSMFPCRGAEKDAQGVPRAAASHAFDNSAPSLLKHLPLP